MKLNPVTAGSIAGATLSATAAEGTDTATGVRLAYITSMATGGLAGFNYRELREMHKAGADVEVFVTKYHEGPYMVPTSYATHTVSRARSVLGLLSVALTRPLTCASLVVEALRYKSVVDLLIAADWSHTMFRSGRTWIHCHWGDHKLYIGYFCHRLVGIPLSVTLHGYDVYANPNWAMLETSLARCTRIITISEHNVRLLREKYPQFADRLQIVRLSADMPDIATQKTNLLIVGGFQPRKGYDTLLEALHRLDRDDLHLWVVGYPGPVDVIGLVKRLGLEGRVTIFGQVSDELLSVLYRSCDIFCMPSRFDENGVGEGLPVALMEAMSYGKPIVATRHTGIPELVPDLLVEENDSDGLAEAIARLADDPVTRLEMGQRNRAIVADRFSNRNVQRLLDQFTSKSVSA